MYYTTVGAKNHTPLTYKRDQYLNSLYHCNTLSNGQIIRIVKLSTMKPKYPLDTQEKPWCKSMANSLGENVWAQLCKGQITLSNG